MVFFDKLSRQTDQGITSGEQRLAALIRLGLTHKEMGELLYISPESVKKAKNRLTKKLDLPSGYDLSQLIMKL